jgi:hypothetical protein
MISIWMQVVFLHYSKQRLPPKSKPRHPRRREVGEGPRSGLVRQRQGVRQSGEGWMALRWWQQCRKRTLRDTAQHQEVQWAQTNWQLRKRHSKRGKKIGRARGRQRCPTVSLSMYSVTENIYCSQLSPVAILLQPEPDPRALAPRR